MTGVQTCALPISYTLLITTLRFFVNKNIEDISVKTKILKRLRTLLVRDDNQYNENLIFIPNDGNDNNKKIFENIIKIVKKQLENRKIIKNQSNSLKWV